MASSSCVCSSVLIIRSLIGGSNEEGGPWGADALHARCASMVPGGMLALCKAPLGSVLQIVRGGKAVRGRVKN